MRSSYQIKSLQLVLSSDKTEVREYLSHNLTGLPVDNDRQIVIEYLGSSVRLLGRVKMLTISGVLSGPFIVTPILFL